MSGRRDVILIVTNKMDLTADMVILALKERDIPYTRFNTEDFPQKAKLIWKLTAGDIDGCLELPHKRVQLSSIKSVWFRRPVSPVISSAITDDGIKKFAQQESQEALSGLWRTLDCFWMSHPDAINKASYKPWQLKVAQQIGFQVPISLISNSETIVRQFQKDCGGRIIAKPLYSGLMETAEGTKVIFSTPIDNMDLTDYSSIELAPVLFQEYIAKEIELRITVIGNSIFATEIDSQAVKAAEHDWRRAAPSALRFRSVQLPAIIADNCIKLVSQLGLTFGAIDMIKTPSGKYVFLEVNPNGQWGWLEYATGDHYVDAVVCNLARREVA